MDISEKLAVTAVILLVATIVSGAAAGITMDFRKRPITRVLAVIAAIFASLSLALAVAAVWTAS